MARKFHHADFIVLVHPADDQAAGGRWWAPSSP